jgi:hypothetical protein
VNLFFNDPRVGYVTRHRRIGRSSLAALVVGGVGVAALGVIVGSAGYDTRSGFTPPSVGNSGFALPVATPGAGGANADGPVGMGAVPAAPVPVLDLGGPGAAVAPSAAPSDAKGTDKSGNQAVVRVENSANGPKHAAATAAPRGPAATNNPANDPTNNPATGPAGSPTIDPAADPGTAEGPTDEPAAEPGADDANADDDGAVAQRAADDGGWDRGQWGTGQRQWHQWGDGHRWRPWWER